MEGIILLISVLIITGLLASMNQSKTKSKRNKYTNYNNFSPTKKWNEETQSWEPVVTNNEEKQETTAEQTTEPQNEEIDYKNAYQPKLLFTKNEWHAHRKLRDIAEVKGYVVCPKVRLLDIIEPRKDQKKYKTLFYKIQAKHIDFLICDKDMHIKAIIELDDNSHDNTKRKERDEFVDEILRSVGYKVIHTKYINYDILDLV